MWIDRAYAPQDASGLRNLGTTKKMTDDERIALFLDYENLAIGARGALGRLEFDFRPIADALAERDAAS